ncbi:MAG TPA: signal peptidase I [Candidatus Limnocylindrales bacterium]|nr:signal peptidase I [Candidatus Limnocylindrales bacterium]
MTRRRALRLGKGAVLVALLVGWALTLRPQLLGGPATFLVVRGMSMLPTYDTGDFVVLERQPAYAIGDVVGYRVPAGEVGAGRIVLHRIVDVSPTGFVVRGDNNDSIDPWTPTASDIAGRLWIDIPGFGRVIAWLHEPAAVASLLTTVVVMSFALRRPSAPARAPAEAARRREDRAAPA